MRTRLMTWMTPFEVITSGVTTRALFRKTFESLTRTRTFLPFNVSMEERSTTSAARNSPAATWYRSTDLSFDLLRSSAFSFRSGTFANAESVGANTVYGPGCFSTWTRWARFSSFVSVLKLPAPTAVCTMSGSCAAATELEATDAPPLTDTAATATTARAVRLVRIGEFLSGNWGLAWARRGVPCGAGAATRDQRGDAVDGRQTDQSVDHAACGVRGAELLAENPCNEVELRNRHEPPVESADDHERGGEQV